MDFKQKTGPLAASFHAGVASSWLLLLPKQTKALDADCCGRICFITCRMTAIRTGERQMGFHFRSLVQRMPSFGSREAIS
jgi:MinD superfamily P-loop ATPase